MRLILLWCFCVLTAWPAGAEEMVAKVQRELRARKYYFGEVHGRATEETTSAIAKFQKARGIDSSGNLDDETLKALGLPFTVGDPEEARFLGDCCGAVERYLQAWQKGEWQEEAAFFADEVQYYDDHSVSRDFIRETRAKENLRWPQRKSTLLQRIASRLPSQDQRALVQVTARVRTEVTAASKETKSSTEDLIFWLEKKSDGWRIFAVKALE